MEVLNGRMPMENYRLMSSTVASMCVKLRLVRSISVTLYIKIGMQL